MAAKTSRKLDVILVLGPQNSRKGTLIRHLTGVARDRFVKLGSADDHEFEIRVIVSSVNEKVRAPNPPQWAARLLRRARRQNCYRIILPIRSQSPNGKPAAERYYEALSAVGNIRIVLATGVRPSWLRRESWPVPVGPSNNRAANVRRLLRWK